MPLLYFVNSLSGIKWSTHCIIRFWRWIFNFICFGISLTVTHRASSIDLICKLVWTSSSVIKGTCVLAILLLSQILSTVSSIAWFHLDHLTHLCGVKGLWNFLGLLNIILLTLRHWMSQNFLTSSRDFILLCDGVSSTRTFSLVMTIITCLILLFRPSCPLPGIWIWILVVHSLLFQPLILHSLLHLLLCL
jgi:hypothetical protein